MKKTVSFLLALGLLLALPACGAAPAPRETEAPAAVSPTDTGAFEPDFTFQTQDILGETWTEACFADAKLTMINFWEPWCPPCIAEMPDLQRLSEDYAEQGFRILGVYSSFSYEDEMRQVLERTGVEYPILLYVEAFDVFQTGYVPTTVFVDENGRVVGQTQVGGRSYEDWAGIVEELL